MLELNTNLQGEKGYFGELRDTLRPMGFTLCGSWEYDGGFFDGIL